MQPGALFNRTQTAGERFRWTLAKRMLTWPRTHNCEEAPVLRLLLSTGNIFLSLVLGALMLALVGYNSPETLSEMLGWARNLKGWITSTGLEPKYNIWLELLLEERQLLFMFFTIIARILLFVITAPFSGMFRG